MSTAIKSKSKQPGQIEEHAGVISRAEAEGMAIVWLDPRHILEDQRNERGPVTAEGDPELDGLAQSIRESGVIEPLRVYRDGGDVMLASGHRRRVAATMAGMALVPCVIVPKPDDVARDVERLASNVQRRDIDAMSMARTIKRILEAHPDVTQAEVAAKLGMSQPALANHLRLLGLPVEVQQLIMEGTLSKGHGLALLQIKEPIQDWNGKVTETVEQWQVKQATNWASGQASVREAENRVASVIQDQAWQRKRGEREAQWKQQRLQQEAAQAKVTPEELEAKRKEERKASMAEGRVRTKRVKAAQAALVAATAVQGDFAPRMAHLRLAAAALNRFFMEADVRRAWGLPGEVEVLQSIVSATDESTILNWIARLALAQTLAISYDGKSFETRGGMDWKLQGGGLKQIADETWGISDAIKEALAAAEGGRLADTLGKKKSTKAEVA